MKKKSKAKARGASRMKQLGRHAVRVFFAADELELVARACAFPRGALATFVRIAAVRIAREILAGRGE